MLNATKNLYNELILLIFSKFAVVGDLVFPKISLVMVNFILDDCMATVQTALISPIMCKKYKNEK